MRQSIRRDGSKAGRGARALRPGPGQATAGQLGARERPPQHVRPSRRSVRARQFRAANAGREH